MAVWRSGTPEAGKPRAENENVVWGEVLGVCVSGNGRWMNAEL